MWPRVQYIAPVSALSIVTNTVAPSLSEQDDNTTLAPPQPAFAPPQPASTLPQPASAPSQPDIAPPQPAVAPPYVTLGLPSVGRAAQALPSSSVLGGLAGGLEDVSSFTVGQGSTMTFPVRADASGEDRSNANVGAGRNAWLVPVLIVVCFGAILVTRYD